VTRKPVAMRIYGSKQLKTIELKGSEGGLRMNSIEFLAIQKENKEVEPK